MMNANIVRLQASVIVPRKLRMFLFSPSGEQSRIARLKAKWNGDFIWIVVNAGGNSREKEAANTFNASACRELTERRLIDQADILAEG